MRREKRGEIDRDKKAINIIGRREHVRERRGSDRGVRRDGVRKKDNVERKRQEKETKKRERNSEREKKNK